MPAITDVSISAVGTTAVDCSGDGPCSIYNASDEIMTLTIGASDPRLLAVGATLRGVAAGAAVVASHGGAGNKTLQVLRSVFPG